jgi:hypothetical protein
MPFFSLLSLLIALLKNSCLPVRGSGGLRVECDVCGWYDLYRGAHHLGTPKTEVTTLSPLSCLRHRLISAWTNRENMTDQHRLLSYYGYSFESYCTSGSPTAGPPGWGGDVNTNVQHGRIVKTKLGGIIIVPQTRALLIYDQAHQG